MNWLAPAIAALLIYGIWGFLPKLSTQYLSPQSAILYEVLGALLFGAAYMLFTGARPEFHPKGAVFAVLTGISLLFGGLFYLFAASRGNLAAVVTLTALYPAITILLSYWVLGESISIRQMIGMGLGLCAIICLTT